MALSIYRHAQAPIGTFIKTLVKGTIVLPASKLSYPATFTQTAVYLSLHSPDSRRPPPCLFAKIATSPYYNQLFRTAPTASRYLHASDLFPNRLYLKQNRQSTTVLAPSCQLKLVCHFRWSWIIYYFLPLSRNETAYATRWVIPRLMHHAKPCWKVTDPM